MSDPVAKMRRAGGCAIFCGVVTWIMMALFSETYDEMFGTEDIGLLKYIDVFLIFGLSVGIFMRSRIACWSMFIYFTGSKLVMWHDTGAFQGIGVSLVFMYFFFQGALGSLEYHRNRRDLEGLTNPNDFPPPPDWAPEEPVVASRSLAAATDIPAGARIDDQMLEVQRTLGGLDIGEWERVVGSVTACDISRGELLRDEHLVTS